MTAALDERGSLVLDIADLQLHHPAAVEVFAEALAAAGGWPTARLVLVKPDGRITAALSASGLVGEVPVAADLVSGRARLCLRPDSVTRRLRLRPERSAPRRARSFVTQAGSAWSVKHSVRDDAATVAADLVARTAERARSVGILTVSLDRSGSTSDSGTSAPRAAPLRSRHAAVVTW